MSAKRNTEVTVFTEIPVTEQEARVFQFITAAWFVLALFIFAISLVFFAPELITVTPMTALIMILFLVGQSLVLATTIFYVPLSFYEFIVIPILDALHGGKTDDIGPPIVDHHSI